jgi:uncharacterized membrane protein YphA (DoxX/SURF4 family)
MKRKIIIEIISSLLIVLFLYTGLSKWLDFKRFIGDINNQPFPNQLTPFIVWALPVTEVLVALALVAEKTRVAALWVSFGLMVLFTIYTILILLHVFHRVPCSCGGVIRGLSWTQHLFFNLFFTGISLTAIILKRDAPRGGGPVERALVK